MDAKSSRLVTTTLLGVAFGIICMLLSKYTAEVAYWPIGVSFLLHHTVMGFAIGASSLKINWAAHGAVWGALFGDWQRWRSSCTVGGFCHASHLGILDRDPSYEGI